MQKKYDVIPEGWRTCEYCGKPFKKKQGQRFCDIYCRTKAYEDKARVIKRDYRKKWLERKKEGETE